MKIQKIRGTQDQLDLQAQSHILQQLFNHLELYGFSQISTPILESLDLFVRSLGQATDVVGKELFKVEQKGSEQICLRPEATAGVTRAYLENQHNLATPWKTFSFGPMFRYERPQKGRWRQFNQFNIECIQGQSFIHDVEMLLMLDRFFSHVLGLESYTLKLNYLGTLAEREKFKQELQQFLQQHSAKLCTSCVERTGTNPLRCLDCKNPNCQSVYKNAPSILDFLELESEQAWKHITDNLEFCSVNFVTEPKLVRGLDYYQGLVFEFVSSALGAQDAFCGGGRYELATALGSKDAVPAVGAAIGIERLLMLLEAENKLQLPQKKELCAVLPMTAEQASLAIQVNDFLHHNNKKAVIISDKPSVKSMMRQADKLQAKFVIFIGKEELQSNTLTVKNMQTGQEHKVEQAKVLDLL